MRLLDPKTRAQVQAAIAQNLDAIRSVRGFVAAEPGFPVVDGRVLHEPSILIFVRQKLPPSHLLPDERAPRQLGPYRVAVMQANPERQIEAQLSFAPLAAAITESGDGLSYVGIEGDPIDDTFKITKPMLCHVGPDAGWPTLKSFIEGARKTLSVAMYDFNADYIATAFIAAVQSEQLDVVLTWDDGMTAPETKIRDKLKSKLGESIDGWIVKCGANRRFQSAYHEKVAVRDSKAFWLSSGNWSTRSQPEIDPIADPSEARGMFSKGNREWHVIVENPALAKVFEKYIKHDRDGSKEEAEGEPDLALDEEDDLRMPDLFVPLAALTETAPAAAIEVEPFEPKYLPSEARPVTVRPLLTPDNYVGHIRQLLQGAKRSIYMQFAYITWSEAARDAEFTEMLQELAEQTYDTSLDVRIIVGSSSAADKIRQLVEAGFNDAVFRVQSSVHNKGIIVDQKAVLVSSANWSGDGVIRNRDAGLLISDAEIASYYQGVFLYDWDNRARSYLGDDPPVLVADEGEPTPPGMARITWRDYHT